MPAAGSSNTKELETAAREAWKSGTWGVMIAALRAWKGDDALCTEMAVTPRRLDGWERDTFGSVPRKSTQTALRAFVGEWTGFAPKVPSLREAVAPIVRWAKWADGPNLSAGSDRRLYEVEGMLSAYPDDHVISPQLCPGEPKITLGDVRRLVAAVI